jgi:hypothetical protein
MITITHAPPYLTVQDAGRRHSRAFGVPGGGAMDLFALEALNSIVGNSPDAAALEWALSGGSLKFEVDSVFAIGGARARAIFGGNDVPPSPHCMPLRAPRWRSSKSLMGDFSISHAQEASMFPLCSEAVRPTFQATLVVFRDA